MLCGQDATDGAFSHAYVAGQCGFRHNRPPGFIRLGAIALAHIQSNTVIFSSLLLFLSTQVTAQETHAESLSIWERRILADASRDSLTLTARRPNYFMVSYMDEPNRAPYVSTGEADELKDYEVKYQISLQTKITDDLFGEEMDLWFGYTQVAYWQIFSSDISSPFRETNYEPEIYFSFLTDIDLLGLNLRNINLGFVHQSNGRTEPLSRSWNRVYLEFQVLKDEFAFSFKPWYRIGEVGSDDNPDIEDYLGQYEFRGYYRKYNHVYSVMVRNLFDSENRQNYQLDWSFPISKRLRGLVQWHYGYGENLIDYNYDTNRLSIGVLMTDWL